MTPARRVIAAAVAVPRLVIIGIIRIYQLGVSPLLGPRCKYYPSCSAYGLEAVRRHGAIKGFALGVWRVLRCNPWSHGGVDDVPATGEPLFRRHRHSSPDAHASLTTT
ncbi:membrane protein insertion efficiency factor YidD [Demequina sp. NBRC 110056]|uniref:membrane protein insertion efficiency factor YidD n=1 Tax=Demequina sp. NBRC 110056 TaxID=1570345 RepID=UPI0009FBB1FF|nr:membrane protein insertion efficiency factor YidD [Demequina sp. NBRC 110056]